MTKAFLTRGVVLAALFCAPALASAQSSNNVEPSRTLPPSQSDNDPHPTAAGPRNAENRVVTQAGVGGPTAYGRGGVLELGGSVSFSQASDTTVLTVSPTVGWFFTDNLELSGIVNLNYANEKGGDGATYLTALAEPSVHMPFSDIAFGFVGLGVGMSYSDGPGAGFALAPRLGMNFLVGRSGVLTPALNLVYSTTEAIQTPQGRLLAVNMSYGLNVGYTVMW